MILFNAFLDLLRELIGFLPSFQFDAGLLTKISSGVSYMRDFLVNANFILPLPDIVAIISFHFSIHLFKFTLFSVNWIIRRFVDAVP